MASSLLLPSTPLPSPHEHAFLSPRYFCTRQSLAAVSNNIADCEPRRADGPGIVSPVIVPKPCLVCPSPGEDILCETIPYPFYMMTRCAIGYRLHAPGLVIDSYLWDFDTSCGLEGMGRFNYRGSATMTGKSVQFFLPEPYMNELRSFAEYTRFRVTKIRVLSKGFPRLATPTASLSMRICPSLGLMLSATSVSPQGGALLSLPAYHTRPEMAYFPVQRRTVLAYLLAVFSHPLPPLVVEQSIPYLIFYPSRWIPQSWWLVVLLRRSSVVLTIRAFWSIVNCILSNSNLRNDGVWWNRP